ncbi:MAG: hypothetical protein JW934_00100 [Anaerolineae bacterium]|nr:hypothetical protein [Anaerolineae bacterium]
MARWTRPTLDTKFHIDFDWWKEKNRQLRVCLHQNLCAQCRESYPPHRSQKVDWINPDTAEVHPVDGLWQALRTHCSTEPDYITQDMPLTNAVFRIFLANGNTPLTAVELSARIGRPADKILQTIGHLQVYDGIKPI